jgi:plastocyanin
MVVVEAANRAATFEHIFTESGEYPYFCLLHPNMVGTVSMS